MRRPAPTALLVLLTATGCGQIGAFGRSATFGTADQQICVETALRRAPDMSAVDLAFQRFDAACRRGDPGACSALGVMYEQGLGAARAPRMAFSLFERSCRAGNDGGCVNLGHAYANGIGVAPNSRYAAELFQLGCRQDDVRGCSELASLHATGSGVVRDTTKASQLYARACEGQRPEACYALARLHDDGVIGPDPMTAISFYEKACMADYADSCERLDEVNTAEAPVIGSRDAVAAPEVRPVAQATPPDDEGR